jgi:4-amino-4-deoxy-L-arabinose transferase-like glycosyltransferase
LTKLGFAAKLAIVVAVALLLKMALLLSGVVAFDSDEAIVGLMARHILEGERPVFFYGQSYMGSLDAWLVAGFFALWGPSVWGIRAVQTLLFLVHVALTGILALDWSRDQTTALLSALWMALPPTVLTLYTTISLGGYGETLVFGDLLLLIGYKLATDRQDRWHGWILWGLLAGLGFWTLELIVVYMLPVASFVLWKRRGTAWKGYLAAVLAFAAGSSPWWLHRSLNGVPDLLAFYGSPSPSNPLAPVLPLPTRLLGLLLIGLPGLIGVRLPWSASWLAPVVVLPIVTFYAAVAVHAWAQVRKNAWNGAYLLLWGLGLTFVALFVFSRFGSDPTGRYLVPLYTPLALSVAAAMAALQRRIRWGAAWIALPLLFNLWATWQGAIGPAGFSAQYNPQLQYGNRHDPELIGFLEDRGQTLGYTHYWIAFKIAFLSEERVILAPHLPHKASGDVTPADDRYPPYAVRLSNASQVVYVTGNQPDLDLEIRTQLARRGIAYQEQIVGPYHVFYDLASPVRPSDLDPRWP